jgi:arginase family enzyme
MPLIHEALAKCAEPLWWSIRQLRECQFRARMRELDLIGADVVEVSPPFDMSGNTAIVAATMVFEILCLLAEHARFVCHAHDHVSIYR